MKKPIVVLLLILFVLIGLSLIKCQFLDESQVDVDKITDTLGAKVAKINNAIIELKIDSVSVCTDTMEMAWKDIKNNKLGLHGRRPKNKGAFLGSISAKKKYFNTIATNNWFPLLPQKVTVCGIFDHFGTHHASSSGEEKDWNIFIKPDLNSSFVADLAFLYKDLNIFKLGKKGGKWNYSDTHDILIEGEITPYSTSNKESILGFPVKNHDNAGTKQMEGQRICIYGPPVREFVHNNRPEIHPAEIIWWNQDSLLKVIVLQDASNRYIDKKQYSFNGGKLFEDLWHPWSEKESEFQLLIPFQLNLKSYKKHIFNIYQEEDKNALDVLSNDDKEIFLDTNSLKLKIAGEENDRLVVKKVMDDGNKLKLELVDICKNEEGTSIQGYIKINMIIGEGSSINEGLLGLSIEHRIESDKNNNLQPARGIQSKDTIILKTVSIYPKKQRGHYALYADYRIEKSRESLSFSTDTSNKKNSFFINAAELNGLPLDTAKDSIHLSLASNQTYHLPLPERDIRLTPISRVEQRYGRSGNNTSTLFKNYLSIKNSRDSLNDNIEVCAQKQAILSIYPRYIFCEQGDCNIEDDAEEVAELNKLVDYEMQGHPNSYNIKVVFEAVDLFTDSLLDINSLIKTTNISNQKSAKINAKSSAIKPREYKEQIIFKKQDESIFKLQCIITITDTFGIIGVDTSTLYSHELDLKSLGNKIPFKVPFLKNRTFLEELVNSMNLPFDTLFQKRIEDREKGICPIYIPGTAIIDTTEIKYQAVLNFYEQVTNDKQISPNELTGLIKSIRYSQKQ